MNIVTEPEALTFQVENLSTEEEQVAFKFTWTGHVPGLSADDILGTVLQPGRPPEERESAEQFLRDALTNDDLLVDGRVEQSRIASAISQLDEYAKVIGHSAKLVLAFPGRANEQALKDLAVRGIEVWDIDKIADLFGEQIAEIDNPYFRALFSNTRARATLQEKFIRELEACPAGHAGWVVYQKLIGRILSDLLCPPLTTPLGEHSDAARANRRDYVFPNYATDGFWQFIRARYSADYIVVDAKNGKSKITKTHVLQIANYLKVHGVGMFGIIICRGGIEASASVTMREQWILHNKMILVLNDADLENMLLAKAADGDPTAFLSDRIQEFRLSM